MRNNKISLGKIEIEVISIPDWDTKKKALLDMVDFTDTRCHFDKYFSDFFYSQEAWHTGRHPYARKFFPALGWSPEDHYGSDIHCTALWCQRYEQHNGMDIHDHGHGMSGILYAEFDPQQHRGTDFVSPIRTFWDDQISVVTPEVKEGDMLLFPSQIHHYVRASVGANKHRTIFSFNVHKEGYH